MYTYIHTLHYITLHYITVQYITLHYITLHYIRYIHYIHYIHYMHAYMTYVTYITHITYITYITCMHTYIHTCITIARAALQAVRDRQRNNNKIINEQRNNKTHSKK